MAWCKYSREVLIEAVGASVSMAGVLRHLNLRQNGGTHAHLRRRIAELDIDTSHFLGRAHLRGTPNPGRRAPRDVLVLRSQDRGRAAPSSLRRALIALGRAYRCESCDVGESWNGRRLILHVDHIDGRFWDCRPENLRFLCPNCHSQTPTYAGRNRSLNGVAVVLVNDRGEERVRTLGTLPRQEWAAVLSEVEAGELGATEAARLIGCHRNHIYRLKTRMAEFGSLWPTRPSRRRSDADRDAVIGVALAHPRLGPKKIATTLRERTPEPINISHGTTATILAEAGLGSVLAREKAAAAVRAD